MLCWMLPPVRKSNNPMAPRCGQPRRIVQVTVGEQARIRTDPRSVKRKHDGAVKTNPQGVLACFTHWVPSLSMGCSLECTVFYWVNVVSAEKRLISIWEIRDQYHDV